MLLEEMLMDKYMEGMDIGRSQGTLIQQKNDILVILSDIGTVPETLKKQIISESSADRLNRMVRLAAKAESIEDFKKKFDDQCD